MISIARSTCSLTLVLVLVGADLNPAVVTQLTASLALNLAHLTCDGYHAAQLGWGAEHAEHVQQLARMSGNELYDVLLGSDVAYTAVSVRRLFETVDALLSPGGTLVLAYVSRWRTVDAALADAILRWGFTVTPADLAELLPPGAQHAGDEGSHRPADVLLLRRLPSQAAQTLHPSSPITTGTRTLMSQHLHRTVSNTTS